MIFEEHMIQAVLASTRIDELIREACRNAMDEGDE